MKSQTYLYEFYNFIKFDMNDLIVCFFLCSCIDFICICVCVFVYAHSYVRAVMLFNWLIQDYSLVGDLEYQNYSKF